MSTALTVFTVVLITAIVRWLSQGALLSAILFFVSSRKSIVGKRNELLSLEKQLRGISAKDNFAKWAKLSRKIESMKAEYRDLSNEEGSRSQRISLIISTVSRAVGILSSIVIWYKFSGSPVLYLPANTPWFVDWILRLPSAPEGAVGVAIWSWVCSSVVGKVIA